MANQQFQIQPQPQQPESPAIPIAVSGTILLGIAGFLGRWAFNHILGQQQRQVDDLKAEVKELRVYQSSLREEFVSKEDFLRVTLRFEEHLDRFGAKIDRLLEKG